MRASQPASWPWLPWGSKRDTAGGKNLAGSAKEAAIASNG